jgi:hypothetical protein
MSLLPKDCCVLNSGNGAWAFEPLAAQLSSSLGVDVAEKPRRFNYLLHVEEVGGLPVGCEVFIPTEAVRLASDKRLLAAVFHEHGVPTPLTWLFDSFSDVLSFVRAHTGSEWCLKHPTGCAANGHRMITEASVEPPNWPRPFIVQEFIRMKRPEVYRVFCAAGELCSAGLRGGFQRNPGRLRGLRTHAALVTCGSMSRCPKRWMQRDVHWLRLDFGIRSAAWT